MSSGSLFASLRNQFATLQRARSNPLYRSGPSSKCPGTSPFGCRLRAIKDYGEAIRLDPKYAIAYEIRAQAYENKGDSARARKDFDEAARLRRRAKP
jgi:tetratricopeptide (TPR) repeat protein